MCVEWNTFDTSDNFAAIIVDSLAETGMAIRLSRVSQLDHAPAGAIRSETSGSLAGEISSESPISERSTISLCSSSWIEYEPVAGEADAVLPTYRSDVPSGLIVRSRGSTNVQPPMF